MSELRKAAYDMLKYIECLGSSSVIAGGFLRDIQLGRPDLIRDIDVYVPSNDFEDIRRHLMGVSLVEGFAKGDDEYDHQYITEQAEGPFKIGDGPIVGMDVPELLWPYPVNLIGIDTQKLGGFDGDLIAGRFNLSSSQIYMELQYEGSVIEDHSDAFEKYGYRKQVRILRDGWGHTGTVRCVRKFLDKYPDWSIMWNQRQYLASAFVVFEREFLTQEDTVDA